MIITATSIYLLNIVVIFFPVLSVMAISDFRACSTICPVEYKFLTYNKLRIYVRSKLTGQLLATIYLSIISIRRAGRQVQLNGAFSPNSRTSAPYGDAECPIQRAKGRYRAMAHRNHRHNAHTATSCAAIWRNTINASRIKHLLWKRTRMSIFATK